MHTSEMAREANQKAQVRFDVAGDYLIPPERFYVGMVVSEVGTGARAIITRLTSDMVEIEYTESGNRLYACREFIELVPPGTELPALP